MVRPCAVALLFAASCPAALAREPGSGSPPQADADVTSLLQRTLDVQAGAGTLQQPRLSAAAAAPQAPAEAELGLPQAGNQRIIHMHSAKINLDLPPEERWVDFITEHRDKLFTPSGTLRTGDRNTSFQSKVDVTAYPEFLGELRGIVKAANDSRITMEIMLEREFGYERGNTAGCTALLAATPNGTVYHGRNLDIAFGSLLFAYIVDVTYYRGGQPLFVSTQFIGNVGVHTGYRIGKYSVAQNTRPGVGDTNLNIQAAKLGASTMSFLIRDTLQSVDNFQDAVSKLAEAPVVAPQYFTLAGANPWEGALINRDRLGTASPHPNVEVLSPTINRWYIAQTNDDTWKPALDDRRPTILHKLSGTTSRMVTASWVLDMMMTDLVLNPGTAITWVLEPSTGHRSVHFGLDELRGIDQPSIVTR